VEGHGGAQEGEVHVAVCGDFGEGEWEVG
jgi:hypothetical protein